MTITDLPLDAPLGTVTLDLYRDIHKAIRVELFSVTAEAGRLDPAQGLARAALAGHVHDVVDLLVTHAEHEDGAIQPALEANLPDGTVAGLLDADGAALVVHAAADDERRDPSGNSGARIACGAVVPGVKALIPTMSRSRQTTNQSAPPSAMKTKPIAEVYDGRPSAQTTSRRGFCHLGCRARR